MFSRRQVLTTCATLPAVVGTLAAAGCEPLDAALGKKPPPPRDVLTLQAAIAAEQDLIDLYNRTLGSYSALSPALTTFLTEHREHLSRLRSRVSYPPGYTASPSPSARPSAPSGSPPISRAGAIAAVRDAESAAAAAQLTRLATASPWLAQLLASIATAESTHAAVLESVS